MDDQDGPVRLEASFIYAWLGGGALPCSMPTLHSHTVGTFLDRRASYP